MSTGNAPSGEPVSLDTRDRIYAGIRVLALLGGIAFALLSIHPGVVREAVLTAFAAFAGYGLLLYLAGLRLLRTSAKSTFYAMASALDLVFVACLMYLTGQGHSPFYRALYLWVAMLAFYFGLRAGVVGSFSALALFGVFYALDPLPLDHWVVVVQAGGIVLHGPLIGYLTDRELGRASALREAHDRLAEANRRLLHEQERLVRTEKLSTIGMVAAGVAHEINNPLSGVMGCVKALQERTVPEDRRDEYFRTVRDGLERMRATMQRLLDLARHRPPVAADLDVADVLADGLQLVAPAVREKDLRVSLRVAPGEARVRADRTQVMQAIVNVLLNAAHASSPRGALQIDAPSADGRVGVRVVDEGHGIPREILGRVCDPFFTTRPEGKGTGLGLAITLGIVRAHGGELAIESEVGKGTSVTIWLPGGGGADARA